MIDKSTFIICLLKLLGLEIILIGIFLALFSAAPIYQSLICIGSLIFAIGSNILLAINIHKKNNFLKEDSNNAKSKHPINCQAPSGNHCVNFSSTQRLPQENAERT